MIFLKQHTTAFEDKYFDITWKNIESKVKKNIGGFSKMFPEAKNGTKVNIEFFKDLLIMHPEDFMGKYECAEYYFVLTKLCFTDLQDRIKGTCSRNSYKDKRLEYLKK